MGKLSGPLKPRDGGAANDAFGVRGTGTQTVTYTPSATTNGNGSVVIDGKTISFTGLEPMDFDNVGTFNLSPPGMDDVIAVANDFNTMVTGAAEPWGLCLR